MSPEPLRTARLTLFAATAELLTLELESPSLLGAALSADVPEDWPPGEYDSDAMQFFLAQLSEGGPAVAGWFGWYAVARSIDDRPATLVGCGGFLGPPDADGMAEIGYSVSSHWRGRGIATEMVSGLVERAREEGVRRVTARTRAENPSSIAVLERNGFQPAASADPEMLLFELYL